MNSWKQADDLADEQLADDGGGTGSGRSVFRVMVLAAARLAPFPRGNSGCVALEMAGVCSVGAWIRSSLALCLGLRVDRIRHTRAGRTAKEIGGGGVSPLRAEPDVRGLRSRVARALGGLRTRQPNGDRRRSGRCHRCASVCGLL